MSGQITTKPSVLQILVDRLHQPVGAVSRERAALHLLDWLGQAKLGLRQPAAAGFIANLETNIAGQATAISGAHGDWWQVLQLNAALGNLLEMDDLHRSSILHPGPVIVPAAIAVAEKMGASGEALLTAIVRGYEATIRIGAALGTTHYRYFHNTSTCGTFGAAAAAASLLNLDRHQTAHALANAGSRTGGLWQMRHEACETKSLHNVMAAQTGVQAALMAVHGVRGPLHLLDGPEGLFAAMSDGANADNVVADMDANWRIHEVSFKPWPACRHAHPVIDAALAVLNAVDIETIEKISIETYKSALDFCNKPTPVTEHDAKFSLQHCAAVVFANAHNLGNPTLADFQPAQLQLEPVVRLRKLVEVRENAEMSKQFPAHYQASITVTHGDGRVVTHLQHDAKGDPEVPLSTDEITAKARMLMTSAEVLDVETLIAATLAIAAETLVANWTKRWTHA